MIFSSSRIAKFTNSITLSKIYWCVCYCVCCYGSFSNVSQSLSRGLQVLLKLLRYIQTPMNLKIICTHHMFCSVIKGGKWSSCESFVTYKIINKHWKLRMLENKTKYHYHLMFAILCLSFPVSSWSVFFQHDETEITLKTSKDFLKFWPWPPIVIIIIDI